MKVVVTVSKTFFPQHPNSGKPTYFEQKILAEQIGKAGITITEDGEEKVITGRKKHTCRSNYEYWKGKIGKLQTVGGVLSVRQWSANPYRSPQETITDIPANVVGIQKLELTRSKQTVEHFTEERKEKIAESTAYEWMAKVEGYITPIGLLAQNDGLTKDEFKAWFSPVFDKMEKKYPELSSLADATTLDFAIIHFTKERY